MLRAISQHYSYYGILHKYCFNLYLFELKGKHFSSCLFIRIFLIKAYLPTTYSFGLYDFHLELGQFLK